MTDEEKDVYNQGFMQWMSSYGVVTVQRIFDLLNLSLNYLKIKDTLSDRNSIYYQFLRVPFVHIFNNIIIGQIEGYREYIQRVFIDYLLSGAANEAEAPVQGATIREELEHKRQKFMKLADEFDIEYFNHNSLIAESQMALIKLSRTKFQNISEIQDADMHSLLELVADFEEKAENLTIKFREFRKQFQDMIISMQALLETLPNYHIDEKQIAKYKESIDFDVEVC